MSPVLIFAFDIHIFFYVVDSGFSIIAKFFHHVFDKQNSVSIKHLLQQDNSPQQVFSTKLSSDTVKHAAH